MNNTSSPTDVVQFTHGRIIVKYLCSERSIKSIRANVRLFGSTTAPPNRGGRPPTITPPTLAELREHLLEKPNEDLDDTRWTDYLRS